MKDLEVTLLGTTFILQEWKWKAEKGKGLHCLPWSLSSLQEQKELDPLCPMEPKPATDRNSIHDSEFSLQILKVQKKEMG